MIDAIPTLCNMPNNTCGIHDVRNAQSARLLRRGLRNWYAEVTGKIEGIDMRPPGIEVVYHQMHYEVRCPILMEMTLQQ